LIGITVAVIRICRITSMPQHLLLLRRLVLLDVPAGGGVAETSEHHGDRPGLLINASITRGAAQADTISLPRLRPACVAAQTALIRPSQCVSQVRRILMRSRAVAVIMSVVTIIVACGGAAQGRGDDEGGLWRRRQRRRQRRRRDGGRGLRKQRRRRRRRRRRLLIARDARLGHSGISDEFHGRLSLRIQLLTHLPQ
jgi:hypothetical protein